MIGKSSPEWGTLLIAWNGPSLPIEIVRRGPCETNEPMPRMDGTTGHALICPPGDYLVKAALPAWTGLSRTTVTIPVHLDPGEHKQEDIGDTITSRLASLDFKAALPFSDATVFLRPATGDLSSGRALEFGVQLPSNLEITATIDTHVLRHVVAVAGYLASDAASYLGSYFDTSSVGSTGSVVLGAGASGDPVAAGTESAALGAGASGDSVAAGTGSVGLGAGASGNSVAVPNPVPASLSGPQRYERTHGLLTAERDGRHVLAVVPVDRTGGTVAALSLQTLKPVSEMLRPAVPQLDLSFDDPELNTLWLFMRDGAVRESRGLAESVPGQAKWLEGELKVLGRSPLTATLDAYVLLRANWREDLLAFTEEALRREPDLTDLRVIHAEILGRTGKHADAAATLVGLGRGAQPWPLFRPGMAYALARASLYAETEKDEELPGLDDSVRAELPRLVTALSAICAAMDPDQIPLVLTGSSPLEALRKLLSDLKP